VSAHAPAPAPGGAAPSPFLTDIEAALLDHLRAAARRRPARADGDQLTLL